MAEAMSGPVTNCPWCSAPLPEGQTEHCPSCGAALAASGAEGDIKGVTTLDPEAILRARADVARPRSRILSFITGEVVPETGGPASAESLAPPPDEVRREMLRMQLEAERAEIAAETVALKSDELEKIGIPLSQLGADESVLGPTTSLEPSEAEAAEASAMEAAHAETGGAAEPSADASVATALPAATALPSSTALPPPPPGEAADAEEPPAPA
jgi:hypothetical protein